MREVPPGYSLSIVAQATSPGLLHRKHHHCHWRHQPRYHVLGIMSAFVSGASRGIGLALVERLLQTGGGRVLAVRTHSPACTPSLEPRTPRARLQAPHRAHACQCSAAPRGPVHEVSCAAGAELCGSARSGDERLARVYVTVEHNTSHCCPEAPKLSTHHTS